jgi:hypothetical protein
MTRSVTIEIGGEAYELRFTIPWVKKAQQVAGKPFGQLLASLFNFDVADMAVLLWASVAWRRPKFRVADAEELLQQWVDDGVDLAAIAAVFAGVSTASGFSSGAQEEKDGGKEVDEAEAGESPKD